MYLTCRSTGIISMWGIDIISENPKTKASRARDTKALHQKPKTEHVFLVLVY